MQRPEEITQRDRLIAQQRIEMLGELNSEEQWARHLLAHNTKTLFGLSDNDVDADCTPKSDAGRMQTTEQQPLGETWIKVGDRYYQSGRSEWNTRHSNYQWHLDKRNAFHADICYALSQIVQRHELHSPVTLNMVGSERFISAVKKLVTARIEIPVDALDGEPWLLGCPSGVIDLRDGTWHSDISLKCGDTYLPGQAGKSTWYITKSAMCDPDMDAQPTRWLKFLDEATRGDAELIEFLRRYLGYTLTGDISEQTLIYLHGYGGNGKGVFLNTWQKIMGDYALTAPAHFLTEQKYARHETEIARLQGARMVLAQEVKKGSRWDEQRVKSLTGGDRLTGRWMRGDFFEFDPTFKLLVSGNHLPKLQSTDHAMRRRLRVVPFMNRPQNPDPDLEAKLLDEEAGAILFWAIKGLAKWHSDGMSEAAVVASETREYFEQSDMMSQWINECCVVAANASAKPAELFDSWATWCQMNRHPAGTPNQFGRDMTGLGYPLNGKKGVSIRRVGIGLESEEATEAA